MATAASEVPLSRSHRHKHRLLIRNFEMKLLMKTRAMIAMMTTTMRSTT